jgi:hypothetical protein
MFRMGCFPAERGILPVHVAERLLDNTQYIISGISMVFLEMPHYANCLMRRAIAASARPSPAAPADVGRVWLIFTTTHDLTISSVELRVQ